MGWNRWCVPTSTTTSPLAGTCVDGRLTGCNGHGPKYGPVETVVSGVVISCAVRTTPAVWVAGRDDAEVVQPASTSVMATAATTTSLRLMVGNWQAV
jgi:hypothetical protein